MKRFGVLHLKLSDRIGWIDDASWDGMSIKNYIYKPLGTFRNFGWHSATPYYWDLLRCMVWVIAKFNLSSSFACTAFWVSWSTIQLRYPRLLHFGTKNRLSVYIGSVWWLEQAGFLSYRDLLAVWEIIYISTYSSMIILYWY